MKFSILVPVYNVEKYIRQCIESVINEEFNDYELILVNDGSTDNSPLICQEYVKKNEKVKFFSKDNEGLLLTRRYLINKAAGEYVIFLDSDDYWEPGILNMLNAAIEESKADLIQYRFKRVREDCSLIYEDKDIFPDKTFFQGKSKEEFIQVFVASSRLNTMWSKCVRRSIIDVTTDYSLFKDKKGEDLLQSIALIKNASSIYYINDALYNYRLSESGRGRNFKLKYISDYEVVREYVYSCLRQMDLSESTLIIFLHRYMEGLISYMDSVASACETYSCFVNTCKMVDRFPLYRIASEKIKGVNLNQRVKRNYLLFKSRFYFLLYIKAFFRNVLIKFVKFYGKKKNEQ